MRPLFLLASFGSYSVRIEKFADKMPPGGLASTCKGGHYRGPNARKGRAYNLPVLPRCVHSRRPCNRA